MRKSSLFVTNLMVVFLISGLWGSALGQGIQFHPLLDSVQASAAQVNGELGILFYSVHSDKDGMFDAANSGYYWMRADGTDALLLASWEEIDAQAEGLLQVESISPDGRQVLYLAQTIDGWEAADIFSLDLLSGTVTQHTATVEGESSWRPVWSPDGTQFVYLNGDPFRQFATSVRLFDITTNQSQEILTTSDRFFVSAEWAADGESLAVLVSDPTAGQLAALVVSRDGSIQREVSMPPEAAPAKLMLLGDSLYFVCSIEQYEDVCRYDIEAGSFENSLVKASFVQAIDSFAMFPDGMLLISFTDYVPDGSGFVPPEGQAFNLKMDPGTGEGIMLSSTFHEFQRDLRLTNHLPVSGSPGASFLSEEGDWLTFLSHRGDAAELYRMRPDGSEVQRLTRTPEVVEDYAIWSPDGQQLAFVARDDPSHSGSFSRNRAFLIGADGMQLVIENRVETLFSPPAWSPDSESVLFTVRGENNRVGIMRVEAGSGEVLNLTPGEHQNESPTWSLDGEWIAFSSNRDDVFKIHVMRPDGSDIRRVTDCGSSRPVWSPESEWIAFTADCSGTGGIYRARPNGSDMQQLTPDELPIVGLFSWSPNGRWLAFYAQDSALYLLEIETRAIQQMPGDAVGAGRPSWSPDSEWLLFTGEVDDQWDIFRVRPDGSDLENLSQNPATDWLPDWTSGTASPNAPVSSVELGLQMTSAFASQFTPVASFSHEGVSRTVFSPDDSLLAVRSSEGIYVYRTDALSDPPIVVPTQYGRNLLFSSDSNRIIIDSGRTVQVIDAHTGELLQTLAGHDDLISSIALSPDSTRLASSGGDYRTVIWDIEVGEPLLIFEQDEIGELVIYPAMSLSFSPDGTQLAAATRHTIHVWDAENGEQVEKLGGGTSPSLVRFSPDGSRLMVVSSLNALFRLWDTGTWELIAESNYLSGVSFSPDGQYIALGIRGSPDTPAGQVQIIDATTGQAAMSLDSEWPINLVYSPDGSVLTVGSVEGALVIFDTATGDLLASYAAHAGPISLQFSSDGALLVTAGNDDLVHVWARQ